MKIISLNPAAKYNATGGNILEGIILQTINEINSSSVTVMTDECLKVKNNKIGKILSYWTNWRKIAEADILLVNISNRRLCFFLNFLKRKKPEITVWVSQHHFAFMTYDKPSLKKWFTRFFEFNILKAADIISVSGQYPYEQAIKVFERNKVYYTGVPIKKKDTVVSKRVPGELLFIGTIEERKGIHYLLEALGKVDEHYHMSIAGDYSGHKEYYEKLLAIIKENGTTDKIDFLGRISDEKKDELLQRAYAFVFPTLNEGYGIVMLEAMGYGVPVLAFNNSSIPYIVKDQENGLLVEDRNVKDLAQKITYILTNEIECKRMGDNALETYKGSLTIEEYKQKIRNIYKKAVEITQLKLNY